MICQVVRVRNYGERFMESNKISDSYNNYFDRDITSARCNKVSDISYSQRLNRMDILAYISNIELLLNEIKKEVMK